MPSLPELLALPPYSLDSRAKKALYVEFMRELSQRHAAGCPEYGRILDAERFDPERTRDLEDFPFLPVRLFKQFDLLSVPRGNVAKTMTSSGTTGQQPSRIYLDKDNAANQTKALSKIMGAFLGGQRLPMLVLDAPSTAGERRRFSARAAGILGFSMFGRDIAYALDEDMRLNMGAIQAFQEKHAGKPVFLFGFTFMAWRFFIQPLLSGAHGVDLSLGILLHGGGWKKLADQAVDGAAFRRSAREACGVARVYNYYGMIEQTGSIFMECDEGHLHASIFSDVIIRDAASFAPLKAGRRGLVQLLTPLATSYPGHSILSEDEGELLGEDDCPCGRLGKHFKIHGRVRHAEIRGCSDVHSAG